MGGGAAPVAKRRAGRLLVAVLASCVLAAAACARPSSRFEPTTTGRDGRTVFVIYRPPCPHNASCAAEVVIDNRLYEYPGPPPTASYRTGALYAVGPGSEARTIHSVGSTTAPVLALRIGTDWHIAIPFSAYPLTMPLERQICAVTLNAPGSYCVTQLGFPAGETSL
jgi:hypothetical protein